jgi:geranylgeranyl reductase family protein
MTNFDVGIVGAGPAGSSAAIALARRGYSVAVLDKERFPREKLCGDFLNPANRPLLRELDVEAAVLTCPHEKVAAFRFTSSSGAEIEVPLGAGNDPTAFGLGLRRFDLDYVLLKKAASEGSTVLPGCKVRELKRNSSRWFLRFDRGGVSEGLQARMLIGADGRHSWVAHHLGMTSSAAMQGRAVGVQLNLKCRGGTDGRVEIHLFPGGYAGLVGLGHDTINLCAAIDRDRLPDHRPQLLPDSCLTQNPWLRQSVRAERASEMRSTYPVYFSPRRAYGEAVLLAGDAARVSEPVTGEGIYFAIKSGLLAAETVHQAFRESDFSAARLSLYARDCGQAFRARQRLNSVVRWLIYRPALLSSFIRFSAKRRRLLDAIVHAVCQPETVR